MELIDNLDQAFSALTHELGNSVNSLNVTLEVLLRNNNRFEETKKVEFLERALEQTARQRRFLDVIKTYYKDAAGETEIVPFSTFWHNAMETVSSQFQDTGIEVVQRAPTESFWLIVNRESLARVLTQVFENAVDALEETENPRIELNVYKPVGDRGYTTLVLRDNGSGIRREHLDKVFTPLFSTRPGRAGLGLSTARKIVTKMGGFIEIDNIIDGGAEVRIFIRSVDGSA
jgi:C4-dicarboxylate-specific signal transduction histidine kinase